MVGCATNSSQPVLSADWLKPGTHVGITCSEEIDQATFDRFDVRATNGARKTVQEATSAKAYVYGDYGGSRHPRFTAGWWSDGQRARMAQLGADLIPGRVRRESPDQITFFDSSGRGLQWAAMGGRLYQIAREGGVGRELGETWFMEPGPD